MTAPFTTPTIRPGQLVQAQPQQSGGISPIVQLMLRIQENRQQIAMEKERLGMERQRLELEGQQVHAGVERTQAETAQTKLETQRLQTALDDHARQLEAADAAAAHMMDLYSTPGAIQPDGTVSPTALKNLTAKIITGTKDKKLVPEILHSVQTTVQSTQQTIGEIAQTQVRESQARVQTATEGAQIESGKLDPKLKAAQLKAEQERVAQEQAAAAESRAMRSVHAVQFGQMTGENWGSLAKRFNLSLGSIPPNTVFAPKQAGTATPQQLARSRMGTALTANATLLQFQDTNKPVTDPARYRQSRLGTVASTTILADPTGNSTGWFHAATEVLANHGIGGADQMKMNAYREYANAVTPLIAGSNRPAAVVAGRILRAIVPLDGDADKTVMQKSMFRDVFSKEMTALASGKLTATEAASISLREAQRLKMPADIIEGLIGMRDDAIAYDKQGGWQARPGGIDDADVGDPHMDKAADFLSGMGGQVVPKKP